MSLKSKINKGDLATITKAVKKDKILANKIIKWGPLLKNQVHPLHYLCDRVFASKLDSELAGQIAQCLIDHGAQVNGYGYREMEDTPLVAAASLHADHVALTLIESGADLHHRGCFGGSGLHWAAWCGRDLVVERLLKEEVDLDMRCITHKSTAFFWAAHGRAQGRGSNKHQQIRCAQLIKDAGADIAIPNIEGMTARELLKDDLEFTEKVFG